MHQKASTAKAKPGYHGFQVMGMIEWGHKWKPQKIPGPKTKPKKSLAKFPSLKNLQKAVSFNDITRRVWLYFTCKTMQSGYRYQIVLNTQKNPYLNQATPKKYLPNIPTQKNPGIENFNPPKILWSSQSLEIQRTISGQLHQTAHSHPPFEICSMKHNLCCPLVWADNDHTGGNWQ